MPHSLPDSFLNQTLATFPKPDHIITLCETTKLRTAIDTLLAKGVSSCPVLSKDAPANTLHKSSFIGMIDILDIVAFFLEVNDQTKNWDRGFEAVFETVVQFSDHCVSDIIAKNESTLRHAPVPLTTSLKEALELLGPQKTHRLLVEDENGNLVNIVTQSRMLTHVLDTLKSDTTAKALFDMPLSSIVLKVTGADGKLVEERLVNNGKPLHSIKASAKAVDAFRVIQSKRVTGVAVVDDKSGNLIGNISSRDIRLLVAKSENFENLYSTCSEYLALVKQERMMATPTDSANQAALILNTQSQLPSVLTVSADDSVGYVMYCLRTHFIRRVYLTSGKLFDGHIVHIPSSIVTLSDLMKIFAGCATQQ